MTELEKLGIKIGHYTNLDGLTGATVIIPDNGADIGIDVRGSDTGSINIPAYEIKGADNTVEAIVLTGGSTAGLECSIGVMVYLNSPSVVGAVIYDRKIGKDERPHLKDGFEMAKNSSYTNLEQGNVGVGTGATTGKWIYKNRLKGGFGISIKDHILNDDDLFACLGYIAHKGAAFAVVLDFLTVEEEGQVQAVLAQQQHLHAQE